MDNTPSFLEKFRSGDERTWKEVYDSCFRRMISYAYRLSQDYIISQDLVSEGFIKLFKNKATIHDTDHIFQFLYVVIKRKYIDLGRSAMVYVHGFDGDFKQIFEEPDTERDERLAAIFEAWDSLDPQQKKVVELKIKTNLKTRDIADRLKISPQTVLNHFSQAINNIRKKINHDLRMH